MESENLYEELKKTILGEESENEASSDAGSEEEEDEDEDEENDDEEEDEQQMKIKDETETNLVNLRRTIYLTIMSSIDFEEAGHKLLKIKLEPGQEVCNTHLNNQKAFIYFFFVISGNRMHVCNYCDVGNFLF